LENRLTRDEFLLKFATRTALFAARMNYLHITLTGKMVEGNEGEIIIPNQGSLDKFIAQCILEAVDLVYLDMD
jgi:hypothetical protein